MIPLSAGGWRLVGARPDDVRSDRDLSLWRDVLRRQRGSLASVSSYSKSPELD